MTVKIGNYNFLFLIAMSFSVNFTILPSSGIAFLWLCLVEGGFVVVGAVDAVVVDFVVGFVVVC